jgi:DNA-binding transcriptional MocR family regulator
VVEERPARPGAARRRASAHRRANASVSATSSAAGTARSPAAGRGPASASRLTDAVAEQKALDDLASPALEQLAFAELLGRGEVDRHLRRNRVRYRARRDALVAALGVHAPQVCVGGIAAGLHAVAELPPQANQARWRRRPGGAR